MSGANRAAAGIGLSRVFGLVREALIGATLGVSPAADAFRVAMRIPNIVQNLLGEGALSASFVPVYARLVEEKRRGAAQELAGGVLGFLTAAIIAIIAIIVIFAEPIIWATTLGQLDPVVQDRATSLTRITAPGIGLLGLSAWCLGILNAHRQYFLGYVAPVVWNVAQILVLGIIGIMGLIASGGGPSPGATATWLAIAVAVGSLGQLAIQVPSVYSLAGPIRPHFDRSEALNIVLRRFGPAVGARGVVQLSSFIDLMLASSLATGTLGILSLVSPLYLLPISLFGFSIATAELTEMARRSNEIARIRHRAELGLRKVQLPAGLMSALYFAGSGAIIAGMYGGPSQLLGLSPISATQTAVMALTLAVFACALPATMSARISQNALYALGNVRAPARIAIIRLAISVSVTVLIMFQADALYLADGDGGLWSRVSGWDHLPAGLWGEAPAIPEGAARLGAVGIAMGTATASWVEWALLRAELTRELGVTTRSGLALPITAAAMGTAAIVGVIVTVVPLPGIILAPLIGVIGVGSYAGLLWFQGLKPRARPTK